MTNILFHEQNVEADPILPVCKPDSCPKVVTRICNPSEKPISYCECQVCIVGDTI